MPYGQIAGNSSTNATIYECLRFIEASEAQKFVRKFRQVDPQQQMHTFRELIVGAYLASAGLRMVYDRPADGRTPDWTSLNQEDQPTLITEVANFHIDRATDIGIDRQIRERGTAVYWPNDATDRLRSVINEKIETYDDLVARFSIPYVVALYGDFRADVDASELQEALSGDNGLFPRWPSFSGLLYLAEANDPALLEHYFQFTYMPNPCTTAPAPIESGEFLRRTMRDNGTPNQAL